MTVSMNIHGYCMNIRIHIHEILRLRIYSWILSMKKSRIHIRNIHEYIHEYIHIRVFMESPNKLYVGSLIVLLSTLNQASVLPPANQPCVTWIACIVIFHIVFQLQALRTSITSYFRSSFPTECDDFYRNFFDICVYHAGCITAS